MTAKMPMPFGNPRTYKGHSGIDFPQNRGTPIRASGPGVVLRLSRNAAGGWWTVIRYDNGSTFGYAHQDYRTKAVKPGDRVYEGKIIGHVGSLGKNSTGPHLHLENLYWATEAGVWAFFDRNRVVGQGDPSGGGGSKPLPPPPVPEPEPIPEIKEEEDSMRIFGYVNPEDDRIWYVQFDTSSGFWSEFVSSDKGYIQSVADKWTPNGIPLLSEKHRNDLKAESDVIKARLAR